MEPSESAKAETPASQVAVFVGFAPGFPDGNVGAIDSETAQ